MLRTVAEVLRTRMRSYDVIMRFGGDEFLCAQPGLAIDEARARVLSVRAELSTAPIPVFVTFGLADGIATMFAATQATQLAAAHRTVVASAR